MTSSSIESFNPEPETIEHLSPVAARMMLAAFPPHIQAAFERRAKAINYPVEAVLEMADSFPEEATQVSSTEKL
ncbi:hypothetical protein NIES2135_54700 [Leptolyngbya boryana NIES-2135]|jgi:hypothetical protein|uniref:Uncharacterized protein n=1 Tax=Leptolyngbya boryana NIES-2135 TaxID=1973484 RepID=A0A1Z4JPK9_LEPBY|nr:MULTISPECIES: hypothetical protein [Leptolyngbya]ULP29663.1 hypothetical protein MCP04_27140 [Leptolyngbya boryana IU 594]BAS55259.1 hypothetical protein LBWT_11650 [Leptolyngbya boryana IAM M-101]BAS61607.1 hypothetical protein LBDG_11650 [Leptolyngbya boryana dg5]BAY58597.1 hypothetical protein NIES2135_54700 [Leptolyngbya boryana NIES-2135]